MAFPRGRDPKTAYRRAIPVWCVTSKSAVPLAVHLFWGAVMSVVAGLAGRWGLPCWWTGIGSASPGRPGPAQVLDPLSTV